MISVGVLAFAACSGGDDDAGSPIESIESTTTTVTTITTEPASTATPTTSSTTTTTVPPVCVITVAAGDSLGAISTGLDDISLDELQSENRLGDDSVIHPGDELDICIDNDVDDVTGASRLAPSAATVSAQQRKLNELFAPYSIAELAIDGDSGPLTRQLLCAARRGLGLRASTLHMPVDSPESDDLFAADALAIPEQAPTWAGRWIVIDKTCQVLITGEGDERIVDIFPTSTGEPGFETRGVVARAFRFDPALDNGGWHDSSAFPVAVDNPLNGNMYKPLYFNDGQAIHGANVVPPDPRSKGCARTFPWHQERLLEWLSLDDVTDATWAEGRINATVAAIGDYRPDP